MSVVEPSSDSALQQQQQQHDQQNINYHENPSPNTNSVRDGDVDDDEEGVGISKIQVPRQKHIPISKSHLLDAILSNMFNQDQDDDAHHFRLLTS